MKVLKIDLMQLGGYSWTEFNFNSVVVFAPRFANNHIGIPFLAKHQVFLILAKKDTIDNYYCIIAITQNTRDLTKLTSIPLLPDSVTRMLLKLINR